MTWTRFSARTSLPSANAPLWPAGGWLLAADRTTRTANALDYLQMRRQSLAGMAFQEGRVVTR